jgi:hypothetical protein
MQKEAAILYDRRNGQQDQQDGLNDLAVGMCLKQLVEASRGNVKDNGDEDTPVRLVIQSVHQHNIGNKTDHEIEAVEQTGFGYIAVEVPFDVNLSQRINAIRIMIR